MQKLSRDELVELLERVFPPEDELHDIVIAKVDTWTERDDHVAVYENVDLGHPALGDLRFFSYGSPAAQFEVETAEELPTRLPDGLGGDINWRYTLVGVFDGTTN